ncbi:peptidase domain-containing ABC transporter [Vampirovibrio sp.]|uniref:peptidase domain-containing ABC transporter n=1 Tax=Vampirovibrio sp. TaxID=2717857 RepID=UPI00359425D9
MQTGLICIELAGKLNQISIDTRALVREYGLTEAELTVAEMVRILKHQGFTSKAKRLHVSQLQQYPLPAIVQLNDGGYAVLLKLNPPAQKLLIFRPENKQPEEMTYTDLVAHSTGTVIVLKHKLMTAQIKFGFQWFFKEILHYKRIIGEVLLGSFVIQLFGLITPLFTQVILDKVIVHHAMTTLDVLGVAFLAVMIFEFLLNLSRNYIFTHTANKIDAKLGAKLFKHLFGLPFMYFESRKVGNIVSRIRELDNIRDFITNKSVSVIIDTLFSVVFFAMMLLYSWKLALMVLGFIVLIALLYIGVTPVFRSRLEEKFQMGAQSNSYLVETVTGVQTVKSLAIEGSMQKKWEDYLGTYIQSSFKLNNVNNWAKAISNLLQKAMTIAILYFGVKQVINNQMTVGQLIAFQMFSNQLTNPILRLVGLWHEFQQTLLAVDRLGDILNHPVEVQSAQAITLPQLQGSVRFEKISFRYGLDTPNVLSEVSFNVPPSSSIGLVGRSGSGKSTITKLIQRLYLPQEGAIYVDDVDSRHMNPLWLRNHIGVVLQENYLFSGTIRENIALPRPDASIELIIQAAQVAGAHDFIKELPEGYDTLVGERGSTLSGGQRQRVAIARALITNPRILIFDEATSALDYESERIIQNNLAKIKQGRTVFIIAHRLSTVRDCQVILAMDRGQIVESGTHTELMLKRGYYHMLASQQEQETAGVDDAVEIA